MHEFDMLKRTVGLGRHHHAGAARQAREHQRGLVEHFGQRAAGGGALDVDRGAVVFGKAAGFHQAVDEQAQAQIGRQAPGGGVRGEEQAQLLEIGHDVANRGRGELPAGELAQPARQGARPHRLAGFDIGFDDGAENVARARGHLAQHGPELIRIHGGIWSILHGLTHDCRHYLGGPSATFNSRPHYGHYAPGQQTSQRAPQVVNEY
jgi:hypothetical protein